jgi:hypothetical protein
LNDVPLRSGVRPAVARLVARVRLELTTCGL